MAQVPLAAPSVALVLRGALAHMMKLQVGLVHREDERGDQPEIHHRHRRMLHPAPSPEVAQLGLTDSRSVHPGLRGRTCSGSHRRARL